MPTIKDAAKQRRSYAWMISQIMAEKEQAAKERLKAIHAEQPELKEVYQTYLHLYALHIKPLMPKVDQYLSNIHEKRKIEHFLQGQAEHHEAVMNDQQRLPTMGPAGTRSWTLPPQVERLPYAGPNAVGRAPKKAKPLSHDQADEIMAKLKKLDPEVFAKLLNQIGGKK